MKAQQRLRKRGRRIRPRLVAAAPGGGTGPERAKRQRARCRVRLRPRLERGGRDRHQHLPVLCGRLRAAGICQRRQADPDRRRPAQPDQSGTLMSERGGDPRPLDRPRSARLGQVPRAHSDHWEDRPLDWAMDRIAMLVKRTRDESFVTALPERHVGQSHVGDRLLGGATLDNEENYLIKKLFGGGLGMVVDRKPGERLTQRVGA